MSSYFKILKDSLIKSFFMELYNLHPNNIETVKKENMCPINFNANEHIYIQRGESNTFIFWNGSHSLKVLTFVIRGHLWTDLRCLFVDWWYSDTLNMNGLEKCVQKVRKQYNASLEVEKISMFLGFSQSIYYHHTNEARLVIRTLFRRLMEEQLIKVQADENALASRDHDQGLKLHREIFGKAVTYLEKSIQKDKEIKKTDETARLKFFIKCDAINSMHLKHQLKSLVVRIGIVSGIAFVVCKFFF